MLRIDPDSIDPRVVAVIEAMKPAIESGQLDGELATETIGAVACWYYGYEDLALQGKGPWYTQVLRSVGAIVPWEDQQGDDA